MSVRKVLRPHGTLIQSSGDGGRWPGPVGNILKAVAINANRQSDPEIIHAEVTGQALHDISALIDSGDLVPVIERTYPLA